MQYYARKYNITRLGLQPTPPLAISEANGKEAIQMTMLIESLLQSPFANESWTLQDTSKELVLHTAPKGTFKKLPYPVEVWFDNEASNAFEYINYHVIYVTDENDLWYKAEGKTDYNGLYYIDYNGDKAYFKLFSDEASLYGQTGTWTVRFNNKILSPPAFSSRPPAGSSNGSVIIINSDDEGPGTPEGADAPTLQEARYTETFQSSEEAEGPRGPAARGEASPRVQGERRPRQQGEPGSPPVKRAKADSTGGERGRRGARGGGTGGTGGGTGGSPPTAAEVGERHQSVARRGLSKLARLQEEARDPAIIIVQGPANSLKCWRNRLYKQGGLFENITTAFKWVSQSSISANSRILISFKSEKQRTQFITFVNIPKHCTYSYGSLNAL